MEYIERRMIVDTPKADGNVFFKEDHLEFVARDSRLSRFNFTIAYDNIASIENHPGIKKTVILLLKDGYRQYFYMYKNNTFIALVKEGMERNKKEDIIDLSEEVKETPKEDKKPLSSEDLEKITKLNELRKEGAISEEEFEEQKRLILNK